MLINYNLSATTKYKQKLQIIKLITNLSHYYKRLLYDGFLTHEIMKYAINQLKEEKRLLEKCLSEWDLQKYPDARIERKIRYESLDLAILALELTSNGINPVVSGGFEKYNTLKSKQVFSEDEIQQLQSKIHEITGDGEVMGLFNEMLGISVG